jgi:hypothetical protein
VAYYITYVLVTINALQFVDVKLRNFIGLISPLHYLPICRIIHMLYVLLGGVCTERGLQLRKVRNNEEQCVFTGVGVLLSSGSELV